MTVYPHGTHAVRRIVLRTARGPLRPLWLLAYAAVGLAAVVFLTRGVRGTTVYLRRGATTGEFLPGMSDLDFAIVTASTLEAQRVRERRERLRTLLRSLPAVLDFPLVYDPEGLRSLVGANPFTLGLDGAGAADPQQHPIYFGAAATADGVRTTLLPGLEPMAAGWRRIAGRERRPPAAFRNEQALRIAAWLEVSNWWRLVFPMCLDPEEPHAAGKCVKLVADVAAAWLWLAHGELVAGREDALRRALLQVPQEEQALCLALELQRTLTRSPPGRLAELLPTVVRFSAWTAELLAQAASQTCGTDVRLAGHPGTGGDRGSLPLCDWVALAWPVHAEERLELTAGDLGDPAVLADAARAARPGAYRAVGSGRLLALPAASLAQTRLRAIKCPTTDPVVFALSAGENLASFPGLAGWSALDTAERATAEHRAWLRSGFGPMALAEAPDPTGLELKLLLAAARAALFLDSIAAGAPLITLTVEATAAGLVQRQSSAAVLADEAVAAYAELVDRDRAPEDAIIAALRSAVLALPAYVGTQP